MVNNDSWRPAIAALQQYIYNNPPFIAHQAGKPGSNAINSGAASAGITWAIAIFC
jgi:hypothetical protein